LSLTRRVANYTRWTVEVRLASLLLRSRARRAKTVDETLELIEGFRVGRVAITAWQVRSELRDLLALVQSESPRTVLEIGTALGGTLFGFAQVAAPDAVIVTLDLPEGQFGGGYYPARSHLYARVRHGHQAIYPILGDSHDGQTLARVQKLFGSNPIDFVFVDGDHTYDGVRADYELYGPLVRPGGLIAFHDIVPGNEDLVGGVPVFWNELKQLHRTTEYVESWDQEAYGIGVVHVPMHSDSRRSPVGPATGVD
jgi:predicted O-methyltransferase YrrM